MKPERESSLVEVLDRLLDRGVVLNADLIISVAGIPLIGLNLRAALASMETMLEYGVMEAWDKSSREWYARQEAKIPLQLDEKIIFKAFGYLWQDQGIIKRWVPGVWNVTSSRLLLWLRSPGEVAFEIPLHDLSMRRVFSNTLQRKELELLSSGDLLARIYLSEMDELEAAIRGSSAVALTETI
jgi:Gas vesicle protein.